MLAVPSLPPFVRRHRGAILAAVVAVLLVAVVGPWLYINVVEGDPPERLSLDDVPASSTTTAAASSTSAGSADAATSAQGIDGTWTVASGSQAGYRAKEVLFGQDATAVGRTDEVTGSLTASGSEIAAVEVVVDMASVSSDRSQRDGQFRGRIMSTDRFPTATFRLTEPIALGPVPAEGETVEATATGELTLRGVTRTETFDVSAKLQDGQIVVSATIPVDFDDYDIPDASGGPASVGRSGEIELLLVFRRSASE
jgi:polyisoprenoid-binding protein YceI